MNSSAGGLGGFFIHERHRNNDFPKLQGWWGHDMASRFTMDNRELCLHVCVCVHACVGLCVCVGVYVCVCIVCVCIYGFVYVCFSIDNVCL